MELEDFFREHPQTALAFSGGVDSAYLLYAAVQAGAQVRPYYVKTAFQPQFEYADALRLTRELGVELTTLRLDVLEEKAIADNPPNRCYFCKRKIFGAILSAARVDGYPVVLDGTNASDRADDRPGMRALEELSVLSPLRLCGLTKAEIRRLSREAGLFTWDKPAYACLATRIPTGTAITEEMLSRTEWAEDYLSGLGFTDFRVRTLGNDAKLQLKARDFPLLLKHRKEITGQLKKRYASVLLDLEERK